MWQKAVIITLLLLVILAPVARADTMDTVMEQQMEKLNLDEIQQFANQVDKEMKDYMPQLSIRQLVQDLRSGKLNLNFGQFMTGMAKYIFSELIAHSYLLSQLLVLTVLCSVLLNIQDAFGGEGTGRVAYIAAYLALMTLALTSFTSAINTGRAAVQQMVDFVHAILPVLLSLLAAMGGLVSASVIHPLVLVALGVISTIINNLVFPLILFATILTLVSQISDRFQVDRLAGLFKDITKTLLAALLTFFTGFMAIQGVAGAVADSVTLRTAKFVTGAFVPVVGGMLADAAEALIGTSLLLKNAVGIMGLLLIIALALYPMLKILTLVIIYRLVGALAQPLGDDKIAKVLETLGNMLLMVFAAVAGVGLAFFMAISFIVGLGNVTVMMR